MFVYPKHYDVIVVGAVELNATVFQTYFNENTIVDHHRMTVGSVLATC